MFLFPDTVYTGYTYHDVQMTYADARTKCLENNQVLAMTRSQAELQGLMDAMALEQITRAHAQILIGIQELIINVTFRSTFHY